MFDMFAVPFFLVMAFCVVLPALYNKTRKKPPNQLNAPVLVGAILLVEFVACSLFVWGSPPIVLAIANGPILVVTAIAANWFIKTLNWSLL